MAEKSIALFGNKILENPEFIKTDQFIEENSNTNNTEQLISNKMFEELIIGNNFLYCAKEKEIQNLLRIIYENQNYKNKLLASIEMVKKEIDLSLTNALENKSRFDNVKQKLENFMKPNNESIADVNPYINSNGQSKENKQKNNNLKLQGPKLKLK